MSEPTCTLVGDASAHGGMDGSVLVSAVGGVGGLGGIEDGLIADTSFAVFVFVSETASMAIIVSPCGTVS